MPVLGPRPALAAPFVYPSYVDVSIDGQQYSKTRIPYTILGDAHALQSAPTSVKVEASTNSTLPPVDVYAVDAYEQRLYAFDPERHRLTARIWSGDAAQEGDAALLVTVQRELRDGHARLTDLVLPYPKVGEYTLRLTAAGLHGISINVFVTEGQPTALYIRCCARDRKSASEREGEERGEGGGGAGAGAKTIAQGERGEGRGGGREGAETGREKGARRKERETPERIFLVPLQSSTPSKKDQLAPEAA